MASSTTRHPILVDTDALIAVANSSLWPQITEHIGLTTTNVCKQELEQHVENTRETAPGGSRPYRLHHGSRAALDALGSVTLVATDSFVFVAVPENGPLNVRIAVVVCVAVGSYPYNHRSVYTKKLFCWKIFAIRPRVGSPIG